MVGGGAGPTREVRIAKDLADDGHVDRPPRVEHDKTRKYGEIGLHLGGETRDLRVGVASDFP